MPARSHAVAPPPRAQRLQRAERERDVAGAEADRQHLPGRRSAALADPAAAEQLRRDDEARADREPAGRLEAGEGARAHGAAGYRAPRARRRGAAHAS